MEVSNSEEADATTYKIMIIGDSSVGKTCLFKKLTTGKYSDKNISTIGIDRKTLSLKIKVNENNEEVDKNFLIQLWDTAGQEQFNAISTMYYQGAVGALLVYDVSIFETFEKVKHWVRTLQEAVGKDIIFVIAGNKFDLLNKGEMNERQSEIDAYCSKQNCKHYYTSAKTGFQLDETFDFLIKSVLNKLKPTGMETKKKGKKLVIADQTKKKEKKKCC